VVFLAVALSHGRRTVRQDGSMLPDDAYLQALGKSTYCIAYTEWLVMEVVQRLDRSIGIAWLAPRTMGTIANRFVTAVELSSLDPNLASELSVIARDWKELVSPRNDVAHARPATDEEGRQRLFRWAPGVDIRFITDDVLNDLASRALGIAGRLSSLREQLPPL
jgi:hypothetical protein